MGLSRASEQLRDGREDPRLARTAFSTDELTELRSPRLIAAYPIQLATYQSERDRLFSVEGE